MQPCCTVVSAALLDVTGGGGCLQARAFYGFQIAIENIHSGAWP